MTRRARPERSPSAPPALPTKEALLEFVRSHPGRVGKREIARAFGLRGVDRLALKDLLRTLKDEGELVRARKRTVAAPAHLPEVAVLDVREVDVDGELIARPAQWPDEASAPRIVIVPGRGGPAPDVGTRVLARVRRLGGAHYEGRIIRILPTPPETVLGIYAARPEGGRIAPLERRGQWAYDVAPADAAGAQNDDIVEARPLPGRRGPLPSARILQRLGNTADRGAYSLIAIHSHGLPHRFPRAALDESKRLASAPSAGREDLTALPFVTIDGTDARDFDDAVWAAPDETADNPRGWSIGVAIADVAYFVRRGSALDTCAFERGNSVYFPDRVVPMLPEALSNDLCSLRPGEARAVLCAHMRIARDGRLIAHRFTRAIIRSAARLTYEEVQAAHDGAPQAPSIATLAALYGAFGALQAARERRGALDLDLPEAEIRLDDSGRIASIGTRPRLDSHRLIEEFMIAANVAAASTLEARGLPCLYRVHDRPTFERLEALRDFVGLFGHKLARGTLEGRDLNAMLQRASGTPESPLISTVVLRAQQQATYAPDNLGHFGLALRRYCHFTSPIRRYADLIVHRALIAALALGADGDAGDATALAEAGRHLSMTERRADAAERDAVRRYMAAHLSTRLGEVFAGRITGVGRFGLFVSLGALGCDGLVPMRRLPADHYDHNEAHHALEGRQGGLRYRLGDAMEVRLIEADPLTGSITLEAMTAVGKGGRGRMARRPPKARRRAP